MSGKTMKYTKIFLCLVLTTSIPASTALAQEAGGITGADFLLSPPASRVDAMGGVLDGMGNLLEGVHFNPAVLAAAPEFRLLLNVNPLPNEVTHSQVALSIPMLGGTAAVAAQLLNTGGFTYVNELGIPEATVTIYDAAAVLSYSRYLLKNISLGLSAKGIYRSLGDYQAFAFAGDAGAAAWFETPHIGQRPKAPTYNQLEAQFGRDKKALDGEKEKRIQAAEKKSSELKKNINGLEKSKGELDSQIGAAEEAKRPPLEAKKTEIETALEQRREELKSAEIDEQAALAEIEQWYAGKLAEAQARFDRKVADLDWVQQERRRLFAVIDDPAQELAEEMVNTNIDSSISKTRELLEERKAAFAERQSAYDQRLNARTEEVQQTIASYESQIDSEVGPRKSELNMQIASLKAEKATLEAADPKANKAKILELDKQISAKDKELQSLLADPWLKRLAARIEAKKKEIVQLQADMAAMAKTTDGAIQEASRRSDSDIKGFEQLRVLLNKELKKAKLKRELDILNASRQKGIDKAHRDYKEKEKKLYLRLLDAMYSHEEKIFQARLDSARKDAETRKLDFDTEQQKAREGLDDEWAFQQRLLSAKMAQAKLTGGQGKSGESPELIALKQELAQKEAAYKQAVQELDKQAQEFTAEEKKALDRTIAAVKEERQKMRLVYLQTDKPYLNTSINLGMRNAGTPVKFVAEGAPLPTTFSAALSYAPLNIQNHNLKLSTQLNLPFYDELSVGVGVEYVLASLAYLRGGYSFGAVDRSFSAGFGVRLALGFTEYSVDYAFRPLPDYGLLHSLGISISF